VTRPPLPAAVTRRRAETARLVSAWPPFAAWLAAATLLLVTCAVEGWPPFDPAKTWARWDSGIYLSIGGDGYTMTSCGPNLWCGNAGWFPGYAWLVGGIHLLGLPLAATGLAVSWLAGLGTLIVVWLAFLRGRPRGESAVVLAYAAFAPGIVYDYALFPLSLLSLCTVGSIALLDRGRLTTAGLVAAAGTLAYPVGAALPLAGGLWLLVSSSPGRERLRRLVAFVAPSLAALAAFALDQQLETGHWNAYLLVQGHYGHALQDPFSVVGSAVGTIVHGSAVQLAPGVEVHTVAPALQTLLVAFMLGCVLVVLIRHRGAFSDIERLIALWAVTGWVLGHLASNVSTYRTEAALLPAALLLRRLPRSLALAVATGAVLLVSPMARLYFKGVLF
jgi:hypothetical protein